MEHSFTHSDQKFLFNSSTLRDLKHFGSPKNEYLLKSLILLDKWISGFFRVRRKKCRANLSIWEQNFENTYLKTGIVVVDGH